MIKYFAQLLFLGLPILLCAQETQTNQLDVNGLRTGHWITFDEDGNKRYDGIFLQGHPIGTFTRFYQDGVIKAVMDYDSSGTNVDAKIYDESGKIRAQGNYINKQKEGKWNFFSSKGITLLKVNYNANKIDGICKRYYANGNIMEKTTWSDNILNGLQEIFNQDGEKTAELFYRSNQLDGAYLVFYPRGNLAVNGTYRNNLKEGDWIYSLENGEIDYTLKYAKGKWLNPEVLDERQQAVFDQYEKNRSTVKDPRMYLSDPESYFRK